VAYSEATEAGGLAGLEGVPAIILSEKLKALK
jgi:hypothetical protein